MARDLDLNINGDARRAQQALNDVATGSERAARITDHLSRSFDHLEHEATQAQRRVDELNDEIARTGPTAEMTAELTQLQRRLSDIGDERRGIQNLQGQFRRSTAAAQQLDHQLADVRRELDRLNDEYSRGGDPAVLRRIQEQQRALNQLNSTRRRIASEDEDNQRRLSRIADEAHQAQLRRNDEARRRAEDDERGRRGLLGNAVHDLGSLTRRGVGAAGGQFTSAAEGVNKTDLYTKSAMLGAAIPVGVTALAAAGGAVIGAGAIAAVGIGIKGAIDGPGGQVIKDEFASLVDGLKGRFTASTSDWWQPLVGGIHTFSDALDQIPLEQIFADAKDYIAPLAEGFAGLAKGTGRGIAALVHEAGPVVDRLGKEFGELGGDVEVAFTAISQGADGGAEALGDLLDVTGAVVQGFGMMILGAEHLYKTIKDIPGVGAAYEKLIDFITPEDPEAIPAFANDLAGVAQSADGVAQSGKGVEDAWEGAAAAMQDYEDALHSVYDTQMGLVNAEVAWEQAVDDLDESIRENGKNWDIHTQKGRDNTSQLKESIDAALAYRDAQVASGEQTGVANQRLQEQIAYLEGVAKKAGITKEQFDAMTAGLKNYMAVDSNKTVITKFLDIHYVSTEGRIGSGEDPRTKTGKGYASGGTVGETGFSLVGENGPELRFMKKGDHVATAAQTKQLLSGGGGQSGPPVVRIILEYPDGRVIRDQLVTTAANQGQDVSQYLGV